MMAHPAWHAGQQVNIGPERLEVVRCLQYRVDSVDAYEARRPGGELALVWEGPLLWARQVERLCRESGSKGLPRFLGSTVVEGHRQQIVVAPLVPQAPARLVAWDELDWRRVPLEQAVALMSALAQVLGAVHGAGLGFEGLSTEQIGVWLDMTSGRAKTLGMCLLSLSGLAPLGTARQEAAWRDLRLVGQLLFEHAVGHAPPEDHELVALLCDRQALLRHGLITPGINQVLAGCATPHGDLAYGSAEELVRALQVAARELERPLWLEACSASSVGNYIYRQNNQDACGAVVLDATAGSARAPVGFFCVADGIGGMEDGERASAMAAGFAMQAFVRAWGQLGGEELARSPVQCARMVAALASEHLVARAEWSGRHQRGGTTFTGAVVAGGYLGLGHVGDSRAILVRGGQVVDLTEDHNLACILVQLGELDPVRAASHETGKRSLSRFLSTTAEVDLERVDGFAPGVAKAFGVPAQELHARGLALAEGDLLVLCTDGVHGELDPHAWQGLLAALGSEASAEEVCEGILGEVLGRMGRDNATLVAVRVRAGGRRG